MTVWTDNVESDLQMEFAAQDKQLTLNGKPFYPATIKQLPGALYAPKTRKNSESDKTLKDSQEGLKLSYTLEFEGQKAEDGNELTLVTMSVLGIENQMIRVDNVQIKAIKEADGTVSPL